MNNKMLVRNAMLAAVYVVLTVVFAPISYGMIQMRLSSSLQLLAFFDKRYVAGLTVGCLLANLWSPAGVIDIVLGTGITFIYLRGMRYCRNMYVASLLPVIGNGVVVGGELYFVGLVPEGTLLVAAMLYVALGEFAANCILGIGTVKIIGEARIRKLLASQPS